MTGVTQRQEPGTELNAEQQLEKEELRQQWNRNFEKYIKLEISHQKFSTKAKPLPNILKLAMVDQIVKEEMNRVEEDYGMNVRTLNVIYYLTAVPLLEKEGNLHKEHRVQRLHKKPGWKVRHSRIEHGGTRPFFNIMAPLTLFNEAPKHESVAPLALKNAYLWLSWPL